MALRDSAVIGFLRPGIGQLGTHLARPPALRDAAIEQPPREGWPKLSVVVPSFNQARFLDATLRSIIEQKYENLELIVIDGGSTDASVEVIGKFESKISWWVSEPDGGQTKAINKGMARATGDLMAWINSDDVVAPGVFHRIVKFYEGNPEVDLVYGNRILIDEYGMQIGKWVIPYHSSKILKWADFIPQETMYWRRGTWEAVGGLDETFAFAMDWDFLLRVSSHRLEIRHLPEVLGLFRIHRNQKTKTQIRSVAQDEMSRLRQRELGYVPSPKQVRTHTAPFIVAARVCELWSAIVGTR